MAEQCIARAPGDVDTLLAFGHALQAKPDFKRAAAQYRACLQKDPGNLDAQSGLALIELRQNHLAKADQAAHERQSYDIVCASECRGLRDHGSAGIFVGRAAPKSLRL